MPFLCTWRPGINLRYLILDYDYYEYYYYIPGLSLNLEFTYSYRMTAQASIREALISISQLRALTTPLPSFYVGNRNPNLGLSAWAVTTLPTELSPHPWRNEFLKGQALPAGAAELRLIVS